MEEADRSVNPEDRAFWLNLAADYDAPADADDHAGRKH
jgi:hypothetical protein